MLSLYGPTQDHSYNLTGESTLLRDWQLAALRDALNTLATFRNAAGHASLFNPELR
jgi:hypothetical protein